MRDGDGLAPTANESKSGKCHEEGGGWLRDCDDIVVVADATDRELRVGLSGVADG